MNELIRLTAIEARRLTDEVKADAQRLWAKLLSLYEGGAHIALGYSSWAAYCEQEFNIGKTRAHRLLQAARVINELPTGNSLQVTSQVPESEAIARELVPLLSNPQALDEAWNEAVAEANGRQSSGFSLERPRISSILGQNFAHFGPRFCRVWGSSLSSTVPRRITLSPLRLICPAKGHYVFPLSGLLVWHFSPSKWLSP
jgi:hypothetical protein